MEPNFFLHVEMFDFILLIDLCYNDDDDDVIHIYKLENVDYFYFLKCKICIFYFFASLDKQSIEKSLVCYWHNFINNDSIQVL